RDHLARFPKGVTERMARTKLEALVWAGLAQPVEGAALQSFIEEFPNGAHAEEAKSKLAELERQAAAAREAECRRKAQEAATKVEAERKESDEAERQRSAREAAAQAEIRRLTGEKAAPEGSPQPADKRQTSTTEI